MKPIALFFLSGLAAIGVSTTGIFTAAQAAAAALLPHHAVYALSLASSPGQAVVSADGTMDYQISDACEAWATSQRMDLNVTDSDGTVSHMVSDYVTWEEKDGSLLRFRLRQTQNSKVITIVAGDAIRNRDGSGVIHYSQPAIKDVALPRGTLFPLAQTLELLNRAAQGHKYLKAPLFDGTDDTGAQDSFTVMGNFSAVQPRGLRHWGPLAHVPNGRVSISFFDPDDTTEIPDYDVAMRYWQNGVSDEVAMDFGDFVVKGNLISLTPNSKRC